MFAGDLYGLVLGFGIASLGFGFTRPGFTGGASLAVPLAEQGGVAGVITAANGISLRRRAGASACCSTRVDPHWPFACRRGLLLGAAAMGSARLRSLDLGSRLIRPALPGRARLEHARQDEADAADRPHRVGLQRLLDLAHNRRASPR